MQIDHQIVSAAMDDALDGSTKSSLGQLSALERDAWARYHLIGDVLRDPAVAVAPAEFSSAVRDEVERESFLLVREKKLPRSFARPLVGFAVAASVAGMAVIGVQKMQLDPRTATTPVAVSASIAAPAQVALPTQPVPVEVVPSSIALVKFNDEPVPASHSQGRLNGYLVKFNEQRSSVGVPGVNPYVRIVGFDSE